MQFHDIIKDSNGRERLRFPLIADEKKSEDPHE